MNIRQEQRGTQNRKQRVVAGERSGLVEPEPRRHDAGQADPGHQCRATGGQPLESGGGQCQQCSDAQLPDPGLRTEVRPGRRTLRGAHVQPERDQTQCHQRRRQQSPPVARQLPAEQQEYRPEQVELLLHGQRPEALERRGRTVLGEVVGAVDRQPEVHRIQRTADRVARVLHEPHLRQEQPGTSDRGDHHQGRRRQQTQRPTAVELPDRDSVRRRQLAQQHRGDEEARDHEEDIDPDVAAAEPAHRGMGENDQRDGQRTQPLDVRAQRMTDGRLQGGSSDGWEGEPFPGPHEEAG